MNTESTYKDDLESLVLTTITKLKEIRIEVLLLENRKFLLQLEQLFICKKIYQFIEKSRTWQEVLETVMQKMQHLSKKLDRNITEQDIKYIIYKYNLITIERFIPQLIEKIRNIEEKKELEKVGNIALSPLKKNLYDMINLRNMLKQEHSVLMQGQCIIYIKEYIDFIRYMFFLQ